MEFKERVAKAGSWEVVVGKANHAVAKVIDPQGNELALLNCGNVSIAQNVSNALLMAASPDLLAGCKLSLDYLKSQNQVQHIELIIELQKVVYKAYGL